jgi:hypothetical protein
MSRAAALAAASLHQPLGRMRNAVQKYLFLAQPFTNSTIRSARYHHTTLLLTPPAMQYMRADSIAPSTAAQQN